MYELQFSNYRMLKTVEFRQQSFAMPGWSAGKIFFRLTARVNFVNINYSQASLRKILRRDKFIKCDSQRTNLLTFVNMYVGGGLAQLVATLVGSTKLLYAGPS